MGVGHIACQINTATSGIGIGNIDAALVRANQPYTNRLRSVHGIVIAYKGASTLFPRIIDMLKPAQEAGASNPVIPVRNCFAQKCDITIEI